MPLWRPATLTPVTIVLWLLAVQGAIGAFDTLYFHEWRARLPAGGAQTKDELLLHGARACIYAVIFATFPFLAWRGAWAGLLALLLLAEIAITLADFVIEDRVRKPLGGVFAGERTTHAIMGIVYGAMLANLLPELRGWWSADTALARVASDAPAALRFTLVAMAMGVLASGLRDLAAAFGVRGAAWPWASTR